MSVFNAEKYLAEAIGSILDQTFKNIEFLIINDGSTDGSSSILKEFAKKDKRIKLIHQENLGLAAARDNGIKLASYEYIALMDADDIALSTRIQIQKEFLDTHPEISGVGSQWIMIDTQNEIVGIDFHSTNPVICNELMFAFETVHDPTMMFRKSAYDAVGGYNLSREILVPDYDLYMKMRLANYILSNIPNVVFKWRLNPTGITHSKAIPQTLSAQQVRKNGFSSLLNSNPDQARQTSQNLLMSFPEGTWFDQKLRQLFPEEDRSYLINALKNSPQPEVYFSTLEYLILDWFEGKLVDVSPLVDALKAKGLPWFALQLAIRYGLADTEEIFIADQPIYPASSTTISVLVSFEQVDDDLLSRIENIRQSCPDAEIVAFPLVPDSEACSFADMAGVKFISSASVEDSTWQAAFNSASGRFLAYLEPYFRFEPETFIHMVNKLNEGLSLVYIPSKRHFLEALDENDFPYQDPAPHPRWTSETLLGQNRVVLSGFCHRRELFELVIPPLSECGNRFSVALALSLAHRHAMVVIPGHIREYVPGMSFENRVLPHFKENMINWYFNSGLGTLPEASVWKNIDEGKTQLIAKRLDQIWDTKQFKVNLLNYKHITQFFSTKVKNPLRFSIFRDLLQPQTIQVMVKNSHSIRLGLQCWCYVQFRRICVRFYKPLINKP